MEQLGQLAAVEGVCAHDGWRRHGGEGIANCTAVHQRGAQWARSAPPSLLIVGCARGIARALTNHSIPYVDAVLDAAPAHRLAASVLVFHDDPTDNATLAALRAWVHRDRRVRLLVSDMGDRGERIQRLTLCRNVLLAEARTRLTADGHLVQLDLECVRTHRPVLRVALWCALMMLGLPIACGTIPARAHALWMWYPRGAPSCAHRTRHAHARTRHAPRVPCSPRKNARPSS